MGRIQFFLVFYLVLTTVPSLAQAANQAPATDRAAAIKIWREQCNDPDYDLRLAYIEQAVATEDVSIQRVCIRAAVESDNSDIKNLGLRAAMTATEKIYFDVELPPKTQRALKKAENNAKARQGLERSPVNVHYQWIQNGVIFTIQNPDINKGSSEWLSLARNSAVDERCKGNANIIGDRIKWTGVVFLNGFVSCDLNVQLTPGPQLKGSLQCENMLPYPVTADLF